MTEPVAYYKDYNDGTTLYFRGSSLTETDKRDPLIKPLYEEEQLHSRVKMTQAEFYEFSKFFRYRKDTTIDNMLTFIAGRRDSETENLYKRFCETGTLEGSIKAQAEFAVLWANYNPDNPEETIEIVPEMKWFVVDTNPSGHSGYGYLKLNGLYRMNFDAPKSEATQFDTEEEAKVWSNPFTEVMQLSVEVK